ncbi:MAG: hypothetical protein HKN03_17895 [Acidimicrobiales bacterium]|nr:hypothetical protein [Acidimicrobiales bacterium]
MTTDVVPNSGGTATAHHYGPTEIHQAGLDARAQPKRRYGIAARLLFLALDLIYGKKSTFEKFRVLEVVARVPYQAWEQVAFVAVTHTHEDPSFARRVHDRALLARAQQDNELFHLLIIEELLDNGGFERSSLRGRFLPQLIAFGYYHLSWLLYVVRPRLSFGLNADFEDHAMHTYLDYVDAHPQLAEEEWVSQFEDEYGQYETVADVLTSIALDEQHHRDESVALIDAARFG